MYFCVCVCVCTFNKLFQNNPFAFIIPIVPCFLCYVQSNLQWKYFHWPLWPRLLPHPPSTCWGHAGKHLFYFFSDPAHCNATGPPMVFSSPPVSRGRCRNEIDTCRTCCAFGVSSLAQTPCEILRLRPILFYRVDHHRARTLRYIFGVWVNLCTTQQSSRI